MFHLSCKGCGTTAFVRCACPPEAVAAMGGAHLPGCALNDLGAALVCPPDSGCCQEEHSHDATALACPGQHEGEPCHVGDDGRACVVHTEPGEPCPGEHCGLGVADCTVCRPININVGQVLVGPAGVN